jgi:hypothetical protein
MPIFTYNLKAIDMNLEERKELLFEAQEQLNLAIANIETALRGTSHEHHADAYILGHLRNWVCAWGYDMGVQQYIDKLEEEEYEEEKEY